VDKLSSPLRSTFGYFYLLFFPLVLILSFLWRVHAARRLLGPPT